MIYWNLGSLRPEVRLTNSIPVKVYKSLSIQWAN